MFCEGHHAQKTKRRCKNMQRFFNQFFIDFPSKIDAKSRKKHENRLCAQKSTEIHVWKVIFQQKKRCLLDFWNRSGSLGASRDVPGASQNPSFCHESSVASENGPGRSLGGPEGGPCGPPGHPQGTILGRILDRFYMSKIIDQNINY